MKGRTWFTALLVVILLTALLTPFGAAQGPAATEKIPTAERDLAAQPENIGATWVTAVTPSIFPIGAAFDLCFTVYVQSPDEEYMDHFDIDLPDGWTVNWISGDSAPPANGCSGALPPVPGVNAGNVLYWQSTGYPPATDCGAWNGGSAGTDFDFCANVTIPDDTGAPWLFPWFIEGDNYGAVPHSVSGVFGPAGVLAPAYDESEKEAPATVDYGGTMTYTIEISNTGDAIGMATVMTDVLPAGTSYVPGSLTCTSGTCWEDGTAVYWAGQIAPPGGAALSPAPASASAEAAGPAGVLPAGTLLLSQPGSGRAAAPAANPEAVLWEQVSDGYFAFMSQHFPDQSFGVYSADDFDVGGYGWGIDTIFIDGEKDVNASGSLPLATSLRWLIYPDAAGLPAGYPGVGGEIWGLSLAPGNPAITFSGVFSDQVTVDLVTAMGAPLVLPPGHYWLVFYPTMSFQAVGQWRWDTAGTLNGASAHMIDPLGVFLPPATWTPWGAVSPAYPDAYDAAFRLDGEELPTSVTIEFEVDVSALDCGAIIDNEATISDPAAAPVVVSASTEVTREGGCLGPQISIDPPALSEDLCPDSVMTYTLEICNGGDQELAWQVSEMTDTVKLERVTARPSTSESLEVVALDEGFEGGAVPPADWTLDVTNPGFSWQLSSVNSNSGLYSAEVLYDPALVPQDEVLLSPEIAIQSGILSFWSLGSLYWCRDTYDNCDLNVWIVVGDWDGGTGDDIFAGTADDDWTDAWVWSTSVLDLTPLLPGGPVRIGFQYVGVDGAQVKLDDILLEYIVDVPWLSEDPTDGTVAAGECMTVAVGLDASAVAGPGDYMADLLFDNNDPVMSVYTVPVTMTVWEPAAGADFDWSPMTGTVGSAVYFTATIAAGDPPLVYTWDFGDGFGDVGMEVSHVFDAADNFDVELTVSNACTAPTATHTVTVERGVMQYYLPIVATNY